MKKSIRIAVILFAFSLALFGAACYIHAAIDEQQQIKEVYGTREFYNYRTERSKQPADTPEVSLIAVGDLSYSRGVEGIIKQKNDMDYPLKAISELISSSDIAFANLETPLTEGAGVPFGSMLFRSDPDTAYALGRAGFSVVSLANNHSMNFGEKGLADTFAALRSSGIRYTGAGTNKKEAYKPACIEKGGIRFAFLAYVDPSLVPDSYEAAAAASGVAFMNDDLMKKEIKKAKRGADFVIVSMHAGAEYSNSASLRQKEFARAAIDAGADLVIGQHPHVVQPIEKYHGKYIFYSLGNFVFDQYRICNTREELMIKVYFSKKAINKILVLPVFAEDFELPTA
jgi:poly-gamma-glutamate synthesis protein (capsule biosynthesis protein)